MSVLVLSMLISAGLSGKIASQKERRPAFWLSMGLVTGPIAVAIILWLPSRVARPSPTSPVGPRSIGNEINGLEEMRQRGSISDDEFQPGKVQVLACRPLRQYRQHSRRGGSGQTAGEPERATSRPLAPP